jgi:hypothetical protein
MRMLPRQFKALVEMLRRELSAVEEAIDKQTHANREADKSCETHWSKIPGIIASTIRPAQHEIAESQARHDQNYRQHERAISLQHGLNVAAWWTFAAAVVVGIFQGYIAFKMVSVYEWQKKADTFTHEPMVVPLYFSFDNPEPKTCETGEVCQLIETFQDVGAGPTQCLRIKVSARAATREESAFSTDHFDQDIPRALAPGGQITSTLGVPVILPLSVKTMNDLVSPDKSLYVFGETSYKDMFPGDRNFLADSNEHPRGNWHLVRFCNVLTFRMNKTGKTISWTGPVTGCTASREWNCFDEECGKHYEELNAKGNAESTDSPAPPALCSMRGAR